MKLMLNKLFVVEFTCLRCIDMGTLLFFLKLVEYDIVVVEL